MFGARSDGHKPLEVAAGFVGPIRRELFYVFAIIAPLVGTAWATAATVTPREVRLVAADGVRVYGTYVGNGDARRPTILLFHMSDSNRGEYGQISPYLRSLGFNTLAIDQRSGGRMWNRDNQTVRRLGRSTSYDEALPDLEAALAYVKSDGQTGKILVWGSSYWSALVFVLAASHPEIAAVLAFSPNEYLEHTSVADAAHATRVPVFIASARDEADDAKMIFDAVASTDKVQFVPRSEGQHGSLAFYTPGESEYWAAVSAFLERFR